MASPFCAYEEKLESGSPTKDPDLVILAAGTQAEYKYQGRLAAALEAGYDDFQLIRELRDDCDDRALVEELGTRTSDLVKAHWGEIEAVAAALLERRQLSGREVAQLCYEAQQKAGQENGQ
jgi:hypothetical protein